MLKIRRTTFQIIVPRFFFNSGDSRMEVAYSRTPISTIQPAIPLISTMAAMAAGPFPFTLIAPAITVAPAAKIPEAKIRPRVILVVGAGDNRHITPVTVIVTLHQGFTRDVILSGHFRRIEFDMIRTAGSSMHATAAHAFNDGVKRHINFEHVVEFDASCLHGVSLGDGAGEAVEQEAVGTVGLGDALFDQIDDQVVADQATRFHDGFGLKT